MKTTLQRIGHYELRQWIGRDGASDLWSAYDTSLQQMVALRLSHVDLSDDTASLTRYFEDIERVASLHHPNIIHIYDAQVLASRGPVDTTAFICMAMQDVEGESLADYIERTVVAGKMPSPADIVQLFSSIALALDYAHQHGIIHENLKPSSILLKQDAANPTGIGVPLLTDFALTAWPPNRHSAAMPYYLSPEQIKGAAPSERSDIYALGALLYEFFTGMPPFRGSRPVAVMMQHVNALPTPPHLVNPGISPAVTQVILRCLAKDPQQRYPDAASLAVALANALHQPVSEHLRRFAALVDDAQAPLSDPDLPNAVSRARSFSPKRKRRNTSLVITTALALVLVLGVSFGTLLLAQRGTAVPPQEVGHAFFLNSDINSPQGLNDELEIDLTNIPAPDAGKSYYAWLLGDADQTEAAPIFLGRVTVEHGDVRFLYRGDEQHTDLLKVASRFLVTEDNASNPSSDPLLKQSTWRYYAEIPQKPNTADALHFSLLDHLRHLLVESPELAARGLHGGIAYWFVNNTAEVSNLANSLAGDWQSKDANAVHTQVVHILDYLDGISYVQNDVPQGAPLQADIQAAQVALLGPAPQDAGPPGYVYQNVPPPGYIYLIRSHLNGTVLSPQATRAQHQLAIQINGNLDHVQQLLTQVYQDARQLVRLTDVQLLQPSTLAILNDMATRAREAYSSQDGALKVASSLQQLATFEVVGYAAPKS